MALLKLSDSILGRAIVYCRIEKREGVIRILRFKQPYFVSIHAVERFRERIAYLPTRTIRVLIQAALQDNTQQVQVQNWNKKQCPIYRAKYKDVEYFIPVVQESIKTNSWPVVPTILLHDMEINILYEKRNGWMWKQ